MSVRMLEPSPWYAVGNPMAIITVVVVVTIVVVVSKTIYNVFLHPLSGFPGPPVRSAVHLINYLEEIGGYQVKNAKLLHDKYGPVVRISPDSLSFNTAQSWRDIYTVKPGKPEISKDMHFFTQSTNGLPSILVSNCQDHARIRKLVIHAFSDSALRNQEPLMVSYIDLLMKQLKKRVDGPEDGLVDLMSWYIFTTFDTIGDLCFSEPFNALQTGRYDPWMVSVLNGIKNGRFVRMQRRYPVLAGIVRLLKWISSGSAMVNVSREKHMQITQEKTQRRLDESTPRKDIVTPILQRNSVGKGMSRPEIAQTLILLVTAGSEPTAAGLSGATFNLLRNQAALACLQAEVRNAFSSADEITNHRAQQLPYLRAVIEEALRLYPPVPSRFPRRTGKGGAVIDGHFVPENVSVGTHQFATYQSSANFHNPDQFIPERWLGDAPKEYTGDVKASVQPFSMGPRNCLGKNFAYLQIRVILCKLLWHFDLELAPQSAKWNEQNAHLLWEMKPLMVKLSHRKF